MDFAGLTSAELLRNVSEPGVAPEIRQSLVYLSGTISAAQQSGSSGGIRLDNLNRSDIAAFHEGRLERFVELNDDRFVEELKTSDLESTTRRALLEDWARKTTATSGLDQVLIRGKQLADENSSIFLKAAAKALIERESMGTSMAISNLPPQRRERYHCE